MLVAETKTVPRGVLWMVVGLAGTLIVGLISLLLVVTGHWADTVDKRGLENQVRITVLEREFSSLAQEMKTNSQDHKELKELLRQIYELKVK